VAPFFLIHPTHPLYGKLESICIHRELLSSAPKEGLLQLPSDKCLVNDPIFRKYVELYAKVLSLFPDLLYIRTGKLSRSKQLYRSLVLLHWYKTRSAAFLH
jgi:hypothetical protein